MASSWFSSATKVGAAMLVGMVERSKYSPSLMKNFALKLLSSLRLTSIVLPNTDELNLSISAGELTLSMGRMAKSGVR